MTLPTPLPRRRRFARVPLRIILPNLVTLLALCTGITAIRYAVEGRFETAVIAIVVAAVLDGLDGRLARALKGTSRFGAELDSLSDFICFGVAPALVLYIWSLSQIKSFGWFAALVFAVAAALRLARFNVAADDPDRPAWASDYFTGMPAPAGAIAALLPMALHYSELGMPNAQALVPYEIAYILAIAFLMASRIPHYSGKTIGRIPREHLPLALFALMVTALLIFSFPMEMLIALTLAYFAMIPISVRRVRALAVQGGATASSSRPSN